jgi:UDP-glucose 4-epimerase
MKYVVTGGAGFIGSHLTEQLVKQGDIVTIIDNLNTGKEKNLELVKEKIEFVKGSILDTKLLDEITKDVDGVFQQAALASVQDSFKKPSEYYDVNVNGTENIFKLSKKYGFKVVYASSSSVYGNPTRVPTKESDDKNPVNPYAETKLKGEELAIQYSKIGVNVIALRYFNVFGKRQSKEYAGVITKFLDRITKQKPPIIFGDGSQTRDFIFVGDVVKANLNAMTSNTKNLLVNIGTGNAISILELAEMMIDASGTPSEIIYEDALNGDIKNSQADIDLAIKSFSWKPEMKLRSWLQTTIATLKNE